VAVRFEAAKVGLMVENVLAVFQICPTKQALASKTILLLWEMEGAGVCSDIGSEAKKMKFCPCCSISLSLSMM